MCASTQSPEPCVVPTCIKCGHSFKVFASSRRVSKHCPNCHGRQWPRHQCLDCGEFVPPPVGSGTQAKRCVQCNPYYRRTKRKATVSKWLSATCSVCGAARLRFKNGKLKKCCRVLEHGHLEVACKQCGVVFKRMENGRRTYCSAACLRIATAIIQKSRIEAASRWYACSCCGSLFSSPAASPKFCGRSCRMVARNAKEHPDRLRQRERICNGCGLVFHHTEPNRKGVFCSRKCSLANKHKWKTAVPVTPDGTAPIVFKSDCKKTRIERLKMQTIERVSKQKVFERDHFKCQVCLGPCKREWKMGDPASPTIDHVIPLAKGGTHSYANCRTAHAICNSLKSDRD